VTTVVGTVVTIGRTRAPATGAGAGAGTVVAASLTLRF